MDKQEFFKSISPRVQCEKINGVGRVCFRELSATEFYQFQERGESFGPEDNNMANIRRMSLFLALTISDESGERALDDSDAEEFEKKPFHILTKLFEAGMQANGLGDDEKN